MAELKVAPYGAWKSPITSDLIVAAAIRLGQIMLDGQDIYWNELRPIEGGRNVIVRRGADGRAADVTPPGFNARTTVHEYGGGAYVVGGGTIYFANFADQRLYRQDRGGEPRPITPAGAWRYADGTIDGRRGRLICVREDHTGAGEVVNTLVAVALDGEREVEVLVEGADFYSTPRLSPDGTRLAWLRWNHPNMPWDGTELWVGSIGTGGAIESAEQVAGGPEESIFQPEWSPAGVLHFVSDRTGWWNLYRWSAGPRQAANGGRAEALHPMQAEFGLPLWVFGMRTYGFASASQIVCVYQSEGIDHLALLDTSSGAFESIKTPYTLYEYPCVAAGQVVFIGGSPDDEPAIVRFDLATRQAEVLRQSSQVTVDRDSISIPQAIEFPTDGGLTAHAFFYPPRNREYTAPQDERPPLLVMSHGGPTGATEAVLDLRKQYWTSRGIAVLDVNYGGSTGYGRAYRQRLKGQWGVVDVNDCANGARYLVRRGEVDGNRLAITGGSAGGYTTLCALTFRDDFRAGASHFGISDLEALAQDTHKFESRYEDRMVGPYPERKDLYYERSPIHFTNRLECPVILFQGLEDKVVPPSQAESMVDALRAKGLPVAYITFEGEQHGFRKAENIKRALDAEFYFYARVFGYEPAEWIEPVPIENL
jgi:dipeptidyl aminopeptidase/acylaminoacyl peptidase